MNGIPSRAVQSVGQLIGAERMLCELTELLQAEVERAFAEQEALAAG
jgi:hypothetical protein